MSAAFLINQIQDSDAHCAPVAITKKHRGVLQSHHLTGKTVLVTVAASLVTATALLVGFGDGFAAAPPGLVEVRSCAVNVLMVRHCDKVPPWEEDATPLVACTIPGLLRGENAARLFGPGGQYPTPTRLFARALPPGQYSSRDLYMLWPLSQRLRVWVNTSFAQDEVLTLAQTLLDEREAMCSVATNGVEPTVLISWNHCNLPALAQALGCSTDECMACWDDSDFDKVLWLRYQPDARPQAPVGSFRGQSTSWQFLFRAGGQNFTTPPGPRGYQECAGRPVESANFGFPCSPAAVRLR